MITRSFITSLSEIQCRKVFNFFAFQFRNENFDIVILYDFLFVILHFKPQHHLITWNQKSSNEV